VAALVLGSLLWSARAQATNQNAIPTLPLPIPTTAILEADEAGEAVRAPLPKPPPLQSAPPLPLEPPRYGGLIGDAMVADRPWQLVNPLAPPEYGDGSRNLSVHPTSGRAQGVTLFSIKLFKSPQDANKPKKRKRASGGG
jgi:hypothetical protein